MVTEALVYPDSLLAVLDNLYRVGESLARIGLPSPPVDAFVYPVKLSRTDTGVCPVVFSLNCDFEFVPCAYFERRIECALSCFDIFRKQLVIVISETPGERDCSYECDE